MKNIYKIVLSLIVFFMLSVSVAYPQDPRGKLPAPYNLQVWVEYESNGVYVHGSWECDPDTTGNTLEFMVVKRNGITIGTLVGNYGYTEFFPDATGTISISVLAYYTQGFSYETGASVTWGASQVSIEPSYHSVAMNTNDSLSYYINIFNSGGTNLSFSFPGFDSGNPPVGFISDVFPASGIIGPNDTAYVAVSWNTAGYVQGPYEQDLIMNCSDASYPALTINNEVYIHEMAFLSGIVTDSLSQQTIIGANVNDPYYQSENSLSDGSYMLDLLSTWPSNHSCNKVGYFSNRKTTSGTNAGDTAIIDFELTPIVYPAKCIYAAAGDCNIAATAEINWCPPFAEKEMIYDDGVAEDIFVWTDANNENALRITPDAYPATLSGGSVYLGDGSYPGAFWLYTQFSVLVYDEDATGMPGNLLDSITVWVYHYDWMEFYGLDAQIDSGAFFLSMKQLNVFPIVAPLGIDNTAPLENRSYSRTAGGNWTLSAHQDFMIRAIVSQKSSNAVDFYKLARMSDFDPNVGPASGTMTYLLDTTSLAAEDPAFQFLPENEWYAYAISVFYASGDSSGWIYSNIVANNIGNTVTLEVSDCLNDTVEGAVVSATGLDFPYEHFVDTTDINGICVFDITTGNWDFTISKIGDIDYSFTDSIFQDTSYSISLDKKLYPPRNIWVDSVSATAYWDEPLIMALYDNFDEGDIYINGWQMTSNGQGWVQTDDGGSAGFYIPPTGSTYVCVNDNVAGSGNNGCCDMLITPILDLREAENYILSFDSYYTGMLGMMAGIEYSYDQGNTWTPFYSLTAGAVGEWKHIEVDLTAFSGPTAQESIMFAFHADDGGGQASGWAIDNVDINAGPTGDRYYYVFLDSAFVASVDTTYYKFCCLQYGVNYTVCVATLNPYCGYSEYNCTDFTSWYLHAPSWLLADTLNNDVQLVWKMDTFFISSEILGYNIYRDSVNIAYYPYIGEDTSFYTDVVPEPMCYDYQVSTLYDLTNYGFPGDTGESQYVGPAEVCLVYGTVLPYSQNWNSGSFGSFWEPGDNWIVNGQYGNSMPCAEFKWDPMLYNYEECLVSGAFNGVNQGTKTEPYLDGQFILAYDLALNDNSLSGNEIFNVEVWSNGEWNLVRQYNNADGNFDWQTEEIDITEFALGKVFKIRFMAEGLNSSDILSWYVDNIEVYHYCASPVYLNWDFINPDICVLYWNPPLIAKRTDMIEDFGAQNTDKDSKSVIGYNIFLDYHSRGYSFLDFTPDTFYAYQMTAYGYYYYYVTAVYESCESAPSNGAWVPFIPIGIGENDVLEDIQVFPNPTIDVINIKSTEEIHHLCLLDYSGRMLQCHELSNETRYQLDVSSYEPGVYLLRIDTEQGRAVRKLVVME